MTPKVNKKLQRIAKLEREVFELKAQLVCSHHFASIDLPKFSIDQCTGSAVIIELTALGGRKTTPVAIRDGLSKETIDAIKADIQRSFSTSTELTP